MCLSEWDMSKIAGDLVMTRTFEGLCYGHQAANPWTSPTITVMNDSTAELKPIIFSQLLKVVVYTVIISWKDQPQWIVLISTLTKLLPSMSRNLFKQV